LKQFLQFLFTCVNHFNNALNLPVCRAIFLWLCSKDLTKLNFDSIQKGSPEEILMNLQQGQTTYAVVFEILCRSWKYFEFQIITLALLALSLLVASSSSS